MTCAQDWISDEAKWPQKSRVNRSQSIILGKFDKLQILSGNLYLSGKKKSAELGPAFVVPMFKYSLKF